MKYTFLVLILLSLSVPVFSDCWKCYNNACYLPGKIGMTWSDANEDCICRGANLASIHSQEEDIFIGGIRAGMNCWIGAYYSKTESKWVWTDGSDFDFTHWYPGYPSDQNDCAFLYTTAHLWLDYHCDYKANYMCKITLRNGNCTDLVPGLDCQCDPGYTGPNCETDVDDCMSSPCTYGACQDEINGFTCRCVQGFTGTFCDTEIDECVSSPCINGTCQDSINGFSCMCIPGYTGTLCDLEINECLSSPCINGSCEDVINGFRCTCIPGFTGTHCDLEINECDYNHCFHGNCTDQLNNYTCECDPGYTGYNCEQNINDCESTPCIHGICEDLVDAFMCHCYPGYSGVYCQHGQQVSSSGQLQVDQIVPIVVPLCVLALVLLPVVTGLAIALRISRKGINMKKNSVHHFNVRPKDEE